MTSSVMTGGAGRESSVCTGANSSPPHSAMRLTFDVCQEVVFCPELGKRDSVARTPTVTIRSAIATKTVPPIAVAMKLPRRAANRATLSKLFTPAGICHRTSPGPILHQSPVDRKDNCKGTQELRMAMLGWRSGGGGQGRRAFVGGRRRFASDIWPGVAEASWRPGWGEGRKRTRSCGPAEQAAGGRRGRGARDRPGRSSGGADGRLQLPQGAVEWAGDCAQAAILFT